jgi:hypothetical protein
MVKIMNISTEPKLSSRIQTQGWYRLLEWSRHPNHCAWTCDSRSSLSGAGEYNNEGSYYNEGFSIRAAPAAAIHASRGQISRSSIGCYRGFDLSALYDRARTIGLVIEHGQIE